MNSNIKRTRSGSSNSGTRARFVCFDCGETTAAVMEVYRMMGPVGQEYRSTAFVHRTGTGCNKGRTSSEIYSGPAVERLVVGKTYELTVSGVDMTAKITSLKDGFANLKIAIPGSFRHHAYLKSRVDAITSAVEVK